MMTRKRTAPSLMMLGLVLALWTWISFESHAPPPISSPDVSFEAPEAPDPRADLP